MIPAPSNFQLLSTEFLNDSEIPRKFTCHGLDISPALAWSRPPEGTKSFALIVEDLDAPSGAFTHWLVYNLPPTTAGIPENFPMSPNLPNGVLQILLTSTLSFMFDSTLNGIGRYLSEILGLD